VGILIGLAVLPLVSPTAGGLAALLVTTALISIGNQLASPLLTSLASKAVSEEVQGGVLGLVQSMGSLARFIGPVVGAALIASRTNPNADRRPLARPDVLDCRRHRRTRRSLIVDVTCDERPRRATNRSNRDGLINSHVQFSRRNYMSKEMADKFVAGLHALEESRDVESLVALYADESEIGNIVAPEKFKGQAGAREFWTKYRDTFGEVHSEFRNIFATEDRAALEWHTRGTSTNGDPLNTKA
jgi:hypothetical protein